MLQAMILVLVTTGQNMPTVFKATALFDLFLAIREGSTVAAHRWKHTDDGTGGLDASIAYELDRAKA
ncbi:hypothetical protein VNI00_015735 [Paramarasmius palmivorus]|uniref:Uncharacterized protein n=1 Tax=Paramarasmius palmivorus TaxID=297713 RepID=A0AAW0BIA0_9AGAR